ncbi:MAG: response regulator, partial [Deltaproteobacteria bacterium]|nr:response regulator [Deltaproteobacteria bacterium]
MSAEKILIVDDEAGMQRLLARVLERQGYETITVGSAREALQIIEADPVDLVLTDIKMPGMSGLELLR